MAAWTMLTYSSICLKRRFFPNTATWYRNGAFFGG
jgi:hypothetical protein